jgi:hypothetical protein
VKSGQDAWRRVISRLVGHRSTTVIETVYRKQLRPVIEVPYAIGVTSRRVAPSFTVCISSSTFPSSCYAACPAGGSQTVPRPIA